MIDKSRAPISENCKVRGIGVAVMVMVSTFTFSSFSFSLTETPKRCSSSIINNPRSLNLTDFPTSLCVPMMISTSPFANFSNTSLLSFVPRARLRYSTVTGKSDKRFLNVL
ncbi:hypothetical protein SDC9_142745 [bioreactor metagenome]|uniref:Uncharacterized protein n=1 Tax=bioreactor metagenome TaxID=1076179 RepID=A0A645E1F0_9ZZZZ